MQFARHPRLIDRSIGRNSSIFPFCCHHLFVRTARNSVRFHRSTNSSIAPVHKNEEPLSYHRPCQTLLFLPLHGMCVVVVAICPCRHPFSLVVVVVTPYCSCNEWAWCLLLPACLSCPLRLLIAVVTRSVLLSLLLLTPIVVVVVVVVVLLMNSVTRGKKSTRLGIDELRNL